MFIYIGADHRGFKLKETIKKHLQESGYEVIDFGNKEQDENDDYVDFAAALAQQISKDPAIAKGILICGSGAGMEITANKFKHVRAALSFSADHAMAIGNDDDVNVLVLAADFIDEESAQKIVATWLQSPFAKEERFIRRLNKLETIERKMINDIE